MHAGVFAHQTPIFDSFTASSDYPMQVTTEPGKGGPKVICQQRDPLACACSTN